MPYIDAKFSVKIDEDKEKILAKRLTESILKIPGKSIDHLMLNIEDGKKLYFRGKNNNPTAIFEVKILHSASRKAYEDMTKELCLIAKEELGVAGDNCYVKFDEVENWGMDSYMF
ncbi:MAG: phenylpyruvate tautomerase MIF-related protein [Acutalibacteraceae bacterium]